MENIPQQFKELARSAELYDTVEKIGATFDLHIDQIGELDAEIRDILEGSSQSADFSKHVAERLEIDRSLAEKITLAVNKEIFGAIKSKLQSMTTNTDL